MILNVGAGGATDADKIKYGDSNVGDALDELNESLQNENNESFNFGYKDGVRGFFTNPSRADDSFVPFKGYGQFKVIRCNSVSGSSFDGYDCYFEEDGVIVIYQVALQNWWDKLPVLTGHKNLLINNSSQSSGVCYIVAEVEKGKTLTVTASSPGGSAHSGHRIVVMATGVKFNE